MKKSKALPFEKLSNFLALIEHVTEESVTTINLSPYELRFLPVTILQLTSLEKLYLHADDFNHVAAKSFTPSFTGTIPSFWSGVEFLKIAEDDSDDANVSEETAPSPKVDDAKNATPRLVKVDNVTIVTVDNPPEDSDTVSAPADEKPQPSKEEADSLFSRIAKSSYKSTGAQEDDARSSKKSQKGAKNSKEQAEQTVESEKKAKRKSPKSQVEVPPAQIEDEQPSVKSKRKSQRLAPIKEQAFDDFPPSTKLYLKGNGGGRSGVNHDVSDPSNKIYETSLGGAPSDHQTSESQAAPPAKGKGKDKDKDDKCTIS